MQVFDTLPPASPRQGFLRTVSAWLDAALVEFGPEGTMHYAQTTLHGENDSLFTTGMEERHVIFGDTSGLEAAIMEIDSNRHPNLIFVTSSPVSEIIGTDLADICCNLQDQIRAHLCPWDRVPLEGYASDGRRSAFRIAAAQLSSLPAHQADRNGFFVLGLDRSDWNGRSDLNELWRMMQQYFGLTCRNDLNGRYRLNDLPSARLILVADAAAQPLADVCKDRWGIPSCAGLTYGLQSTKALVDHVASLLQQTPSPYWREDFAAADDALLAFRQSVRTWPKRTFRLCLDSHRANLLAAFLTEELGQQVHTLREDDFLTKPSPDEILIGSGLLCSLYPENDSLCMDYPTITQMVFSSHFPFAGLYGTENLLTAMYALLARQK